jgi:hypothetical protein
MGLSVHAPAARPKSSRWTLISACRVRLAALEIVSLRAFPLGPRSRFLMREEKRGEIREQKRRQIRSGVWAPGSHDIALSLHGAVMLLGELQQL